MPCKPAERTPVPLHSCQSKFQGDSTTARSARLEAGAVRALTGPGNAAVASSNCSPALTSQSRSFSKHSDRQLKVYKSFCLSVCFCGPTLKAGQPGHFWGRILPTQRRRLLRPKNVRPWSPPAPPPPSAARSPPGGMFGRGRVAGRHTWLSLGNI